MLEDLLFHPIFDAKEIDRERGVIVEEINMYEDNPMATADELAEQLLFGAEHPLGYRIAGPRENIMKISRDAILNYRDAHYHSKNMVVILSGNLPERTKQMIHKRFAKAPKPKQRMPSRKTFRYAQAVSRLQVVSKKTAQSHLALAFPGPTYTAKDFAATQVLSTILGGNMSSRLFIQVRERQGLCYYIRSGISPYEDMGAFTIQAGFDTTRIHQAMSGIVDELKKIRSPKTAQLGDDELQKAKEYIAGKMSLRLEDSEEVASWWGKKALFMKKLGSPEEFERAVRAVKTADILRIAARTFIGKKANVVIIGPYTQKQKKGFQARLRL
jgi:predicted Zn-dependent peptidase